jgi:hypothetical protein
MEDGQKMKGASCTIPLSEIYGIDDTLHSGADKSLGRPGRKQTTATEDFDVHVSYLLS